MCKICLNGSCLRGCPNYEPKKVYECSNCDDDIYDGETYYEYDGNYYHESCFEDIAVELLVQNGAYKGTAEVE